MQCGCVETKLLLLVIVCSPFQQAPNEEWLGVMHFTNHSRYSCFNCWHIPDGPNLISVNWLSNTDSRCSKQKNRNCFDPCSKMFQKHDVAAVAIFKETLPKYSKSRRWKVKLHMVLFLQSRFYRDWLCHYLVSVLSNIFEKSLHF